MKCILKGHSFEWEIQTQTQVFFPAERFEKVQKPSMNGITVESLLSMDRALSIFYLDGKEEARHFSPILNNDCAYTLKLSMFLLLESVTHYTPPWGILTGVRPAKIKTAERERFHIREDKLRLMQAVSMNEDIILSRLKKDEVSLYVGIPFCPSRCKYCSFTSESVTKHGEQTVETYLKCLLSELEAIRAVSYGKRFSSVYIGGGTPSTLNVSQISRLLSYICTHFTNSETELTFEAGRADSLDYEKLRSIKDYADRISLNPQTMSDKTLELIGRRHTVAEFLNIYDVAVGLGFGNINTDIILGLPEEGLADVRNTLEVLKGLGPQSLTVHTLSLKRASNLTYNEIDFSNIMLIDEMLKLSQNFASTQDLQPYYLYRQKNMLGSFENVGYAKEGFFCLYNIVTMSERQTVFAAGAGAVTKTVDPETNRIERIANPKTVSDYISRIREITEKKGRIQC